MNIILILYVVIVLLLIILLTITIFKWFNTSTQLKGGYLLDSNNILTYHTDFILENETDLYSKYALAFLFNSLNRDFNKTLKYDLENNTNIRYVFNTNNYVKVSSDRIKFIYEDLKSKGLFSFTSKTNKDLLIKSTESLQYMYKDKKYKVSSSKDINNHLTILNDIIEAATGYGFYFANIKDNLNNVIGVGLFPSGTRDSFIGLSQANFTHIYDLSSVVHFNLIINYNKDNTDEQKSHIHPNEITGTDPFNSFDKTKFSHKISVYKGISYDSNKDLTKNNVHNVIKSLIDGDTKENINKHGSVSGEGKYFGNLFVASYYDDRCIIRYNIYYNKFMIFYPVPIMEELLEYITYNYDPEKVYSVGLRYVYLYGEMMRLYMLYIKDGKFRQMLVLEVFKEPIINNKYLKDKSEFCKYLIKGLEDYYNPEFKKESHINDENDIIYFINKYISVFNKILLPIDIGKYKYLFIAHVLMGLFTLLIKIDYFKLTIPKNIETEYISLNYNSYNNIYYRILHAVFYTEEDIKYITTNYAFMVNYRIIMDLNKLFELETEDTIRNYYNNFKSSFYEIISYETENTIPTDIFTHVYPFKNIMEYSNKGLYTDYFTRLNYSNKIFINYDEEETFEDFKKILLQSKEQENKPGSGELKGGNDYNPLISNGYLQNGQVQTTKPIIETEPKELITDIDKLKIIDIEDYKKYNNISDEYKKYIKVSEEYNKVVIKNKEKYIFNIFVNPNNKEPLIETTETIPIIEEIKEKII